VTNLKSKIALRPLNTDSSNCCDSSWRRTAPDGAGWLRGDWRASESWPKLCLARVVLEGPTEIGARNQIFPGAAIGLEPQDLKYDGDLQVKLVTEIAFEYVINRATRAGEATLIGNGNLLMAYVHVAHNCVIEDSVVISNAVALAGHIHIESR